ncbi:MULTISPECIES: hypothetical protein [Planktothrix]|uniref:hypothetical protein n=1 Tax=Planktothrix TaxID=54304 RepID=UPI0004272ED5|nr:MULTISPECIES: hypothetical protein [Planktothrix]CAD5974305.1 hypothetical protein PCC7811_04004 [Planktothrix agardhii]
MQLSLTLSPIKLAKRLTMGVGFFTFTSILIQIGRFGFNYRKDWTAMFNVDREMNLPTWFSAFMLAFCAWLLGAIASAKQAELEQQKNLTDPNDNSSVKYRYFQQWKWLSIIFWLFAIDEVATIHEILIIPDIAKGLNLPPFLRSMWVIPGIILVIVFLRKYWKFWLHLPQKTRDHFILAASLYIGGALFMEMVGSVVAFYYHQQSLIYSLVAIVEEIMEMMGVIVFMYGLLVYIREWQEKINLEIKILPQ